MLTKDDLYNQSTVPNIKNISLKLYKEFSEHVLMKKIFTYNFEDNTSIKVDFREWGIYHMLAVHHINYNIDKNKFFEEINNGLELSSFEETNSMNSRYKKYKKTNYYVCMCILCFETWGNALFAYWKSSEYKKCKI